MDNTCKLIFGLGLATFSITGNAQEEQKTEPVMDDPDTEEVITVGVRNRGDYTFITEDANKLVETPGSLGDPLAAVFALPGVVYSEDSGHEPAVRGSSPSDNQFTVDFLPASYVFHEFGVSVFSEYILHDFQMHSAGVGAEYSDLTGALFNVTLRDPENDGFKAIADISMLRSGIFVESGITDDMAFYLSYRKSLIHLFIPEGEEAEDGLIVEKAPQDHDHHFKYAWQVNNENKFSISTNGASDDAAAEFTRESDFVRSNPDFEGDAEFIVRYSGASALWEYFGEGGTEFKAGVGQLKDKSELNWGDEYVYEERQKSVNSKAQLSTPLNDQLSFTVGGQNTYTKLDYYLDLMLFVCTDTDPDCNLRRRERINTSNSANWSQNTLYAVTTWSPEGLFDLDLGIQYHENDHTDEKLYHPRLSAALHVTDTTSIIAKAGSYSKLPEVFYSLEETGNPDLKSSTSNHYTLGFQQEFDDEWTLTFDTYYKTFDQLPLALSEDEPDSDLLYVNEMTGHAYGVDILLNKNLTDKWYGWLAFSYGKSKRTNPRTDETKNYHLDTPLIFNWVMNWKPNSAFELGWRWSVRSGSAYTEITGVQDNPYFDDSVLPIYGDPYAERLPLYNRLDIRFRHNLTVWGKESAVILDIINATNHKNVSERVLDYDKVEKEGDEPHTKDVVGIGIIPALSFRVQF